MKNAILVAFLTAFLSLTGCNRNQAPVTEAEAAAPRTEKTARPNDDQARREQIREQARNVDPNNVAGEILDFMDDRVKLSEGQRADVTKLAGKYDFANMSFREQRQAARALRKEIKALLTPEQLAQLKEGNKE